MEAAEIINRKGARKVEGIPENVLALLNIGEIETVNLTEWLAIDHLKLIRHVFPEIGISDEVTKEIRKSITAQKKPSTMNTIKLVGSLLYENYHEGEYYSSMLDRLNKHQSDTIRCYAPYLIALNSRLTIEEKLIQSRNIIADKHFGVREVVWMALRPYINENLKKAIVFLSKWAGDTDEYIRRFTTEATRPRGVWCKHIEALKENPEQALPILEKLKSDKSKYVQDSVGNWLNDASKSKPEFVIETCERWNVESPTKETKRIIKKAKRTIDKK